MLPYTFRGRRGDWNIPRSVLQGAWVGLEDLAGVSGLGMSWELFRNITGTCILHSRATFDDPMFSSDHPALSFEHLLFSCVSSVFFLSPISTSVFSVAGVPHFHQRMGQKLAVSTFPTHGLLRNMFFFIVGGNQKKQETQRN